MQDQNVLLAVMYTGAVCAILGVPLWTYWKAYQYIKAEVAPEAEQDDPAAHRAFIASVLFPVRVLAALLVLSVAGVWACGAARLG